MEHASILASILPCHGHGASNYIIGLSVDGLPTSMPPVTHDPAWAGPKCNF
jgi:hypothetical protein